MTPQENSSLESMSDLNFDSFVNNLIEQKFNYQASQETPQRKPKADKGV